MTTVADEVAAQAKTAGSKCGLKTFLDTQPKADALEFLKIIRGGEASTSAIWRALAKRGFTLQVERVRRHQTGTCAACYPPKKGKT